MSVFSYILSFLASAASVGLLGWAYIQYRRKSAEADSLKANIPAAARLTDLSGRVAVEQKRLADIQAQLNANGTQLTDALHAIEAKRKAEEWLELNKTELDTLAGERRQQQELRASLDQLRKELSATTVQHRELSREAATLDARQQAAREQLTTTVADLKDKSHKLEETSQLVESLAERRSQLRTEVAELEALSQRHHRLEDEVGQLAQRRRDLAGEVDTLDRRHAQLSDGVATLTSEFERRRDALEETETALAEITGQHTTLRAEVSDLKALAERRQKLDVETTELAHRRRALAEEVESSELRRASLAESLNQLGGEFDRRQAALEETEAALALVSEQHATLRAQVGDLKALAERRQQLDAETTDLAQRRRSLAEEVESAELRRASLADSLGQLTGELQRRTALHDETQAAVASLTDQHVTLRAQVAELSALAQRHEGLAARQDALLQQVDRLARDKNELARDVASADSAKQRLTGELNELNGALAEQTQALEELRGLCESLRQQRGTLASDVAHFSTLTQKQETVRGEVEELTARRAELAQAVALAQSQKQQLDDSLLHLRASVGEVSQTLDSRRATCESLNEQRSALRAEVAELTELSRKQKELRQEIAGLQQDRDDLARAIAAAELQKQQAGDELAPLVAQLQQTKQTLAETQAAADGLRERAASLRAEVAELETLSRRQIALRDDVERFVGEQRHLTQTIAAQQAEKLRVEEELKPLTSELASVTAALEQSRREVDALRQEQGTLRGEVAELHVLHERQKSLRESIDSLAREQRDLSQQVGAVRNEKESLEARILPLRDELTKIEESLIAAEASTEELHQRKLDLKSQVAELDSLIARQAQLRGEIVGLAREQRELSAAVGAGLQQRQQIEEQLPALQQELTEKSKLLATTRGAYDALCERQGLLKAEVAQMEAATKRHDELRGALDQFTQEHRQLSGAVATLSTQKQQIDEQLAGQRRELEDTTRRLTDARGGFDLICQKHGALRAEVAELEGLAHRHRTLTQQVAELVQKQNDIMHALSAAASQRMQLDEQIVPLRQELADKSQLLATVRSQHDALCEKQGALKAQVSEFETLVNRQQSLKTEVDELSVRQHELFSAVASAETRRTHLNDELGSTRQSFEEISDRLAKARDAFDTLSEQRGSLKAEVNELQAFAQRHEHLRQQVEALSLQQRELSDAVQTRAAQKEQLDEQLAVSKQQFVEVTTRLAEARAIVDRIAEQHSTIKARITELEPAVARHELLSSEVAALADRQQNVAGSVQQLESQRRQLEEQIPSLRKELEEKTKLLHDTRVTVEALRERQGALRGEVAELEAMSARQDTLRLQVEDLTRQQRELATTVSQLGQQRAQLIDQVSPLSAELAEKSRALAETKQSAQTLAERHATLKTEVAELEALSQRQQRLQTEVNELTRQHTELVHHVAAAERQKQGLSNDLSGVSGELAEASTALEETRSAWESLREKHSNLRTEVAELEALSQRFKSLSVEVVTLSQREAELSKSVAAADARKSKLDTELSGASVQLKETTHALEEARATCESLQERRATLKAEVAELEVIATKHQRLSQEVAELTGQQQELDHTLRSADARKEETEQALANVITDLHERLTELAATKSAHQALTEQVAALKAQVADLAALAERHGKLETQVAEFSRQYAEVQAKLAATTQRQEQKATELSEITSALSDRRKTIDELNRTIDALKVQRNALSVEVSDLESLQTRHHDLQQQIDTLSDQARELAHEVASGQMRRTQIQEKLDALGKQTHEQQTLLNDGRQEIDLLREVRGGLKAEVAELTKIAETYRDLRQAVADLTDRNTRLQQEVTSLDFRKGEAQGQAQHLTRELAEREATLSQIRGNYDKLREQHAELKAQVSELSVLSQSRRQESETLGSRLGEIVTNLNKKAAELDVTKKRHDELSEQVSGLSARREQLEKTVEVVSDTLKEMRLQAGYRGNNAGPLSELWKPALLTSEFNGPRAATEKPVEDELGCLKATKKYLASQGLRFPQRVLSAFHTSLKVSDVSPLVVLAGISGTGKSELARRYAEAMGMHFLNLPVQPRWDSPQDMFGFFNYLENQYRPTELARALVQMDPFGAEEGRGWQPPEGWSQSLNDRMLIVLLDEMNLARVEYYFSEFLSRLEVRRGIRKQNVSDRRKAEISLEVGSHGLSDPTMRVFVDTNVLFVGTINEDETTQTLSDKVVDRSNVLAFGRPPRLTDLPRITGGNGSAHAGSEKFLPFKQWQQWIKKDTDLAPAAGGQVNRWIEELNQAMEMIRRPFAFRTHLAIRSYAANYPEQSDAGLKHAVADQIEQKILPKFRGLDPNEDHVGRSLDRIVAMLDQLGDAALIGAMETARRDGIREHQFVFRGVDRSADLVEATV